MAYEMLLPDELARYAADGTLEQQFRYYDEQDTAAVTMAAETALPDDGTKDKLQELGMHAMLDQRRSRLEVAPVLLTRPLAEPLADTSAASMRFALPDVHDLSDWSAEVDLPQDILDVLLGLNRANVFGRIEVRQTPAGVANPDGVLIVGLEPNKRYCGAAGAGAVYPIARWTTNAQLSSASALYRRGVYSARWIVPLAALFGTLCYTVLCVSHLVFGVSDRTAWLQSYGWQLPLLSAAMLVLGLCVDDRICKQFSRKLGPGWLRRLHGKALEVFVLSCFVGGSLGFIAGCAIWLSAYKH